MHIPNRELLKADNVFTNFLVITHFEPFRLIFSISFDVERTEVSLEFGNEFVVIVGPGRVDLQVYERWFEVVECCPLCRIRANSISNSCWK